MFPNALSRANMLTVSPVLHLVLNTRCRDEMCNDHTNLNGGIFKCNLTLTLDTFLNSTTSTAADILIYAQVIYQNYLQ